MSALTEEDTHVPKRLHQWNLPTDVDEFLDWLRGSGTPGATDLDRVVAFRDYPAAEDVPDSLRQDLGLLLGEPF